MAKYTINYRCEHSAVEQLYGPTKERERTITWKEGQDCPSCWGAKKRADEAAKQIEMHIYCNGLDQDAEGRILAEIILLGGTQPRKEEIKSLGYRWGELRGGVMDMLSISRAPMGWIKRQPLEGLMNLADGGISPAARQLQAEAAQLGARIATHLDAMDLEMIRRRAAEQKEAAQRMADIPSPITPACYPTNRPGYKDRIWNGKIYGKAGRYHIYIAHEEIAISDEDRAAILAYQEQRAAYKTACEAAKQPVRA